MRFAIVAVIFVIVGLLGLGLVGTTFVYRKAEQERARAMMLQQRQMQAEAEAMAARAETLHARFQDLEQRPRQSVEELRTAIASSDEDARIRALLAVESSQPRDALELLARGIEDDSPVVRALAAILIGEFTATDETVAKLGDALADPQVTAAACYALRQLGPAAASEVPELIELLQTKDAVRREQAARTLGAIGPEASDAIPALKRARDDLDQEVRRAAEDALKMITP